MSQSPMSGKTPKTTLDTAGLVCPEPVMLLHRTVRKASGGECIEVIATDPSTQRDIPKFCTHLGHDLVKQEVANRDDSQVYVYWVVKRNEH